MLTVLFTSFDTNELYWSTKHVFCFMKFSRDDTLHQSAKLPSLSNCRPIDLYDESQYVEKTLFEECCQTKNNLDHQIHALFHDQ